MFYRRSGLLVIVALSLIVSIGSAQDSPAAIRFLATNPAENVTGETIANVRVGGLNDIITLAPDVASSYINVEPGTLDVSFTATVNGTELTVSYQVNVDPGLTTIVKTIDDAAWAESPPTGINDKTLRELLGLTDSDMLAVVPGGFSYDYTAFIDGDSDGEVEGEGVRLTKLPPGLDPGYTAFGVPDGTRSVYIELPEGDDDVLEVPLVFIEGGSVMFRPSAGSYVNYTSNKSVRLLAEWFNARSDSTFDTSHYLDIAEQAGFAPQLTQTDRHNFNFWVSSFLQQWPEGSPEYNAVFGDPFKATITVSDSKTFTMSSAPWLEGNVPYVTWANGQPSYVYQGDASNPYIVLSVLTTGGGQVNQVNFLNRPPARPNANNAQIEPIAIKVEDQDILAILGRIQYNFIP